METVLQDMAAAKARAPYYVALAEKLTSIPTKNLALKTVAKATAAASAEESPKMEAADIDLCKQLTAWEKTGWSSTFYEYLLDAPFTIFGIDRKTYVKADAQAVQTLGEIQKIGGLPLEDALYIAGAAKLF